jgi:hypothetical protein
MIMRIRALLTDAVVLLIAPHRIAAKDRARSMLPFDQYNLRDTSFISAVSPPLAPK